MSSSSFPPFKPSGLGLIPTIWRDINLSHYKTPKNALKFLYEAFK